MISALSSSFSPCFEELELFNFKPGSSESELINQISTSSKQKCNKSWRQQNLNEITRINMKDDTVNNNLCNSIQLPSIDLFQKRYLTISNIKDIENIELQK